MAADKKKPGPPIDFPSFALNPYVRIGTDGGVIIVVGKSEMGQGGVRIPEIQRSYVWRRSQIANFVTAAAVSAAPWATPSTI